MSIIARRSAPSTAQTPQRSAVFISTGLLAVVVGQFLVQAAEQAWLGATRSPSYFGPASLLSTGSTGRGALVVGAIVSLLGLSVLLAGVYRLTSKVDVTARDISAPNAARGIAASASASYFTGGLLALAIGYVLFEAGQLAAVVGERPGGGLGSAAASLIGTNFTGQVVGAIVGFVGLAVFIFGTYRLVTNIHVAVDASSASSTLSAA